MKILSIQNISPARNIRNTAGSPLKNRVFSLQKGDSVSFGAKKYGYSSDFLEITEENKDLRSKIAKKCLLDKNKNLDPNLENIFVTLFYVIKARFDFDDKDILSLSAIALRGYDKEKIEDSLLYRTVEAVKMFEYGFSKEQIENVFESEYYGENFSYALASLQSMIGDEMSFIDKKAFLIRYCRAKDGSYDLDSIENLLTMFSLLGLSDREGDLETADFLWELCLDEDYNFDKEVSDFIIYCLKKILSRCADEKNSYESGRRDIDRFRKMVLLILTSLIADSKSQNGGRLDSKSAKKNCRDWLKYVAENKRQVNDSVMVYVKDDDEFISVREAIKKYPNEACLYDNIVYKLSYLLSILPKENVQ